MMHAGRRRDGVLEAEPGRLLVVTEQPPYPVPRTSGWIMQDQLVDETALHQRVDELAAPENDEVVARLAP